MSGRPIWQLDATDLLAGYATGAFTPLAAVATSLDRIAALDGPINAVVAVSPTAQAEAEASTARWRIGAPQGPLDGVPILVKDNLNVAGMPATLGSALYQDFIPDRDELPISRLRAAGAIVIGKTNCPEFALEGYTANELHGVTRNPFDLALTSGGSSGGAVSSVAMGFVPISIGTDGGGSLRRPAAYTGLFGMKPSKGAVARDPALPQLLMDFEVVGPFARTMRDLELAYSVMGGPSQIDPASRTYRSAQPPAKPLRILFAPRLGTHPCDPDIEAACTKAADQMSGMGHRVIEAQLPFDLDDINAEWPIIGQVALANLRGHEPLFDRLASAKYVAMADAGSRIHAHRLYGLLDRFESLRRSVSETFGQFDVILTPSCAAMPWAADLPFPASIDGQAVGPRGHAIYTAWVNASGNPAIAIPAERSSDRLPIGLQLVGDLGSEAMLLALARQYEASCLRDYVWPSAAMEEPA